MTYQGPSSPSFTRKEFIHIFDTIFPAILKLNSDHLAGDQSINGEKQYYKHLSSILQFESSPADPVSKNPYSYTTSLEQSKKVS